jgi:hypothetical protein
MKVKMIHLGVPTIEGHQTAFIISECQKMLDNDSSEGAVDRFYSRVKEFTLDYLLTLFAGQAQSLSQNRWKQVISVVGEKKQLTVKFWKEMFVMFVKYDSSLDERDRKHQTLLLELMCILPNDDLQLPVGLLFERSLETDERDVERLLFECTKVVSSKILKSWIEKLGLSPFKFVSLFETPKTIVSTIEVTVNDTPLQIILNRRTGFVTLHAADVVGFNNETLYTQSLQSLETELNQSYDLIQVLKRFYLVKHMLHVETMGLQMGLTKVVDPLMHFDCNDEIRNLRSICPYISCMKSEVLYGSILCIGLNYFEPHETLQFRIWLLSPMGYVIFD